MAQKRLKMACFRKMLRVLNLNLSQHVLCVYRNNWLDCRIPRSSFGVSLNNSGTYYFSFLSFLQRVRTRHRDVGVAGYSAIARFSGSVTDHG